MRRFIPSSQCLHYSVFHSAHLWGGNNDSSFLTLEMAGIRTSQKQARLPERRRKVVFKFRTLFWCFRKAVPIISDYLCFEIPGQSQHSHARFTPASLLWHQELCLEALERPLEASMMEWLVAFLAQGLKRWSNGSKHASPLGDIWPDLPECLKMEALLGPSSWIQHVESPQIWHHFHTNINLTQIMMQPVTQPISIIIGKEIAKGGPWAVGGQKEIFSSN